jgi:hypothetical protein
MGMLGEEEAFFVKLFVRQLEKKLGVEKQRKTREHLLAKKLLVLVMI